MAISQWCHENKIVLYSLPPNTTHILQPADVSIFKPLKADWKNAVLKWQNKPENIDLCVTKVNFCKVFSTILTNTAEFEINAKNGFRKCGIFPLNPSAVDYTKCVTNTIENIKKKTKSKIKQ